MMGRLSTTLMMVAVVFCLGTYVFPLWSIQLIAPQYPEGMGMNIWISKITGDSTYDLQNINRLNHYIGMSEIHAESIPELQFMRYILAGLIALGLAAIAFRRRWLIATWVIAGMSMAIVGLIDFYRWAYTYGHNLDPDAPIKVPGMTYQPPLFGEKQLLNITATSYPALGGWLMVAALGLGVLSLFVEWRKRRDRVSVRVPVSRAHSASAAVAVTIVAATLAACAVKPSPIVFGQDTCDECRMTISNHRYGAEILTNKGRVYKFDSVECLFSFELSVKMNRADVHSYLVIDYETPGRLVEATGAVYLHSPSLRSPMGMNLTAFARGEDARRVAVRHPGDVLDWEKVRTLVVADESGLTMTHSP